MKKNRRIFLIKSVFGSAALGISSILAANSKSFAEEVKSAEDDILKKKEDIKIDLFKSLSLNENPRGMSPLVNKQISGKYTYTNRAFFLTKLVDKVSNIHKVDRHFIKIVPGSRRGIYDLLEKFRKKYNQIIISQHEYEKVSEGAIANKYLITRIPENKTMLISLDKMKIAKSIIYISNPHLPFGGFYSKNEIISFIEQLPKTSQLIVDECYIQYIGAGWEDQSIIELTKKYDNLTVLRTFSKIYGISGLRIGYYVNQHNNISTLNEERTDMLSQYAIEAALISLDDQEHVLQSIKHNENMISLVKEFAQKNKIETTSPQANFICMFISNRFEISKLKELLKEFGLLVNRLGKKKYFKISLKEERLIIHFLGKLKEVLRDDL